MELGRETNRNLPVGKCFLSLEINLLIKIWQLTFKDRVPRQEMTTASLM